MPDPFIGEVIMFGGNFAPRGWALCDGQLLSISQNSALFSILGTTYGGDGRTTFALPDLRGRVSVHPGSGPGLSSYALGQKSGAETVTLTNAQTPSHQHSVNCGSGREDQGSPAGNYPAASSSPSTVTMYGPTADATMNAAMISAEGGGGSHTNVQPLLGINYIIALVGVFPSRN